MSKTDLPAQIERVAHQVIGCAIEVHRQLGPGLLEAIYEDALCYELREAGIRHHRQVEVPIPYKSIVLRGHRLDLLVDDSIILELKAVAAVHDVHRAQLLSYLRAVDRPLGILINFNVTILKEGLGRVLNERAIRSASLSSVPTSSPSRPSRSLP